MVIDESVSLVRMATKEGTMICVVFRVVFWLSDGVRNRKSSIVGGEECDLVLRDSKEIIDEGFVNFT